MAPSARRELVYELVKRIPPGSVSTYGAVAAAAETSARAVGQYMRTNPHGGDAMP